MSTDHSQLRGLDREHILDLLDGAEELMATFDLEGHFNFVNRGWTTIVGLSRDEVQDRSIWDFAADATLPQWQHAFERVASGEAAHLSDIAINAGDGRVVRLQGRIQPYFDNGQLIGAHAFLRNVTGLQIEALVGSGAPSIDTLTGLLDRRGVESALGAEISAAKAQRITGALIFIDLDDFSMINRGYGYSVGDEVLQTTAAAIEKAAPPASIVGRVGADEFAVIIRGVDPDSGLKIAEDLVLAVQDNTVISRGETVQSSCTAGVVGFPILGASTADTWVSAEIALRQGMDRHRNSAYLYSPGDVEADAASPLIQARTMILDALEEDRLVIYRQPIASIETGETKHYEILARILDGNNGVISPGEFVPQAESLNLIRVIDEKVIELSMNEWQKQAEGGSDLSLALAINISAHTVGRDIAEFVAQKASESGVPTDAITLEITETATLESFAQAHELAAALKALGFKLAIDDFGSGATSLALVRDLEFDYLKLDGNLTRNLATSDIDRQFVSALVTLTHQLGIEVIAEFVDSQEILDALADMGVEFAQGYHIGRPEPFPDVINAA